MKRSTVLNEIKATLESRGYDQNLVGQIAELSLNIAEKFGMTPPPMNKKIRDLPGEDVSEYVRVNEWEQE